MYFICFYAYCIALQYVKMGQKSTGIFFEFRSTDVQWDDSPPKGSDGRLIYFHIANEYGEIENEFEELCITFKGYQVSELASRLEEELGIHGLTVCTKSPLNGKLYPLRLHLPPNNATMHVIVLPPSSKGAHLLQSILHSSILKLLYTMLFLILVLFSLIDRLFLII